MIPATPELTLFARIVTRPEADIDLAQAALLVAEVEYPGLDVAHYLGELDRIGKTATRRIAAVPRRAPIASVVRFLYEELGFLGNSRDYYDPRNSYLNDVLERRTGIPVTLALVMMETCRRVGIQARGVPFPGHFLVQVRDDDGDVMLLDPFDGCLLDDLQLGALYRQATGSTSPIDPRVLEPASKVKILRRLLANLRAIHERRGDAPRLAEVRARMAVLGPEEIAPLPQSHGGSAGSGSGEPRLN